MDSDRGPTGIETPKQVPKYGDGKPACAPDIISVLFVGADNGGGVGLNCGNVGLDSKNTVGLALEEERKAITKEFQAGYSKRNREPAPFTSTCFTEAKGLMEYIRDSNPTVLHFACHSSQSRLHFLDSKTELPELAGALKAYQEGAEQKIRLAIVNACMSADIADVLSAHIDFVIGHSAPLGDAVACEFSRQLYGWLGHGGWSLQKCFEFTKFGRFEPYVLYSPRVDPGQFYLISKDDPAREEYDFWEFDGSWVVEKTDWTKILSTGFFHGFISYHVERERCDSDFAFELWREVHAAVARDGLPQVGHPGWPRFVREQVREQGTHPAARVFLGGGCSSADQRWDVAAKVMAHSLVVVIPLSFVGTDDTQAEGCSGVPVQLSAESPHGRILRLTAEDSCPDQVLLEWTIALELWKFKDGFVQAIVPVLLGRKRQGKVAPTPAAPITAASSALAPAAEREAFEKPHTPTVDKAAQVLKDLGVPQAQIEEMQKRSVRATVVELQSLPCVDVSGNGSQYDAVRAVAERVVEAIHGALETMRSSPAEFCGVAPQGEEVLEWLQREGLLAFSELFAVQQLDSLCKISNLNDHQLQRLCEVKWAQSKCESERMGETVALASAVARLKGSRLAERLGKRLDDHIDQDVSSFTAMVSENGLEMAMAAWFPRAVIAVIGALLIGSGSMTARQLASNDRIIFLSTVSSYTGPQQLNYSIVVMCVLCIVSGSLLIWIAIAVNVSPRLKKQYLRWILMAWAVLQGLSFFLNLGQCSAHQSLSNVCVGTHAIAVCVGMSFLCIVLAKREKLFWILLLTIALGYVLVRGSVRSEKVGDTWKDRWAKSWRETLPHSIAILPLFFLLVTLIMRWRSSTRDADARIARAKDEYNKAWDVVTKHLSSKAHATLRGKTAASTDHAGCNIQGEDHEQQQTQDGPYSATVVADMGFTMKTQPSRVMQGPNQQQQQWGGGVGSLEVRVASGSSPVTGAGSGERDSGGQRASGRSVAAGEDPLSELAAVCSKVVEELRHGQPKEAEGLGKVWAKLMGLFPGVQAGSRGRFSDKGKIRQATDEMEQLFMQAAQVNPIFHDQIWRLCRLQVESGPSPTARETEKRQHNLKQGRGAEAKGGPGPRAVLIRGPVKHPKRAIEKVVRCYSRDAACLTDIVRCTVVCRDIAQVLALLRHILSRATVGVDDLNGAEIAAQPERQAKTLCNCRSGAGVGTTADKCGSDGEDGVFRVVSLKNRFDPDNAEAKRTGYRDLCLNLEVGWLTERKRAQLVALGPSGSDWSKVGVQTHICEVQIHVEELFKVKQESGNHQAYIQWRNLLTR